MEKHPSYSRRNTVGKFSGTDTVQSQISPKTPHGKRQHKICHHQRHYQRQPCDQPFCHVDEHLASINITNYISTQIKQSHPENRPMKAPTLTVSNYSKNITVIILNIGTDRGEQTVQTQIRLLLMEQSDQGLLCLLFCLHLLSTILHCKIQLFQL